MSLPFPITTANSNILVTLTSPSTITTTAIYATPGMVSINPAPAISVAGTGPDASFETRLNAMEILRSYAKLEFFKLKSTLENFISTGKSRGENDRGYLTDFSVSASQSEIDQSSDDESNCGPPPQKNREKQGQLGKKSSAANYLGIFEEINKEKMSDEELGPAISSQLAKVAMKYWPEESKNPVVVNKILDGLKIPANCSGIRVPILNEAVAKNRKNMPFHKRADKRLSDIQKGLIFATSAVLEI